MMASAKRRNPLKRKPATRQIKNVHYVICEGCTEEDYLNMDAVRNNLHCVIKLVRRHPGQTDPGCLVRKMSKKLKEVDFRKNDSAWIALDVDEWTRNQMTQAIDWSRSDSRFHLAVSNPKFELFLIMHYESAKGCTTASSVDARLKTRWPEYSKRIPSNKFAFPEIQQAIERASKRRSDRGEIPQEGATDFHLLMSRLTTTE